VSIAGRSRSATHTAVLIGCILLAFAVFGWGLHAKLSLYSPGAAPSAETVAKLLTGQENKVAVQIPELDGRTHAGWELLLVLGWALVLPTVHVCWLILPRAEAGAARCPVRPQVLSRPPPALLG
jgi:hypothetical protein